MLGIDIPGFEGYVECEFRRTEEWSLTGFTSEGTSTRRLPQKLGTVFLSEGVANLYVCVHAEVTSSFADPWDWGLPNQA